jgi:tRNA nucleotidyltransferase (CCA-adding enzyme)
MIRYYKVGGYVRDKLLGVESKDIDYAVEAPSFDAMRADLQACGVKIFQERPEFQTIRGNHPTDGGVDFVLCRKEGEYTDGRHPDKVEMGTIFDDLARRDFTVNAMAFDESGDLLDPHSGLRDLEKKILRCVGDPTVRFTEDGLRIIRAVRFCITKGFFPDNEINDCLSRGHFFCSRLDKIPIERIHQELLRCFKHDTNETFVWFTRYPTLREYIFDRKPLWLKPSLEDIK